MSDDDNVRELGLSAARVNDAVHGSPATATEPVGRVRLPQPDFEGKRARDALQDALVKAGAVSSSHAGRRGAASGLAGSVFVQLQQAGYRLLPLSALDAGVRLPATVIRRAQCPECLGDGAVPVPGEPGDPSEVRCGRCAGAGLLDAPPTPKGHVRRCTIDGCDGEPPIISENPHEQADFAHLGCLLRVSAVEPDITAGEA